MEHTLDNTDLMGTIDPKGKNYNVNADSEGRRTDCAPRSAENVNGVERVASAIGGALLIYYGLRRGGAFGIGMAAAGGSLLARGATGHCPAYKAAGINTAQDHQGIRVEQAVTINKSPEELFTFWRNFENLPRFMEHLESVKVLDGTHSHWVARAPFGRTVEWDAEIINERANELIAWRSTEDADVNSVGSVTFTPAPANRGTIVRIVMQYDPPGGTFGAAIAKLFGEEPSQQIEGDLRHLRQIMETGEIPTTEGQPAGPSTKRRIKSNVLRSARSSTDGTPAEPGLEAIQS